MEERVYYATTYKDAETKAKRLINKELVRSGKHLKIENLRRIEPRLWKLLLTEGEPKKCYLLADILHQKKYLPHYTNLLDDN